MLRWTWFLVDEKQTLKYLGGRGLIVDEKQLYNP